MTGDRPIPRLVLAILERCVPRRRRAEIIGDLVEDYRAVQRRAGRLGAAPWLTRQVLSLAAAWLRRGLRDLLRARTVLARDVQLAARAMMRRPLAMAAAVAVLGIGLLAVGLAGALRGALLDRPVSGTHGHDVRRITSIDASGHLHSRFSAVEWEQIARRLETTGIVTAVGFEPAQVRSERGRRQTLAELIGPQHGRVIGMELVSGRPLMAPDFVDGAAPVAVVSVGLAQALYGSADASLGSALVVNGRPFSIVGIARAGSPTSFFGASVDLWVPLAHGDAFYAAGWRTNRAARALTLFVLPGETAVGLDARLRQAALDLAASDTTPVATRSLVLAAGTALIGAQRATASVLTTLLLAFSLLILAVAITNVGATMLAAAAAGRRQAAIHAAIGAGPGAAPRRLLIEGSLVGLLAAFLATALYAWARIAISEVALLPTLSLRVELPRAQELMGGLVAAGLLAGLAMAAGPGAWLARQMPLASLQGQLSRTASDRNVGRVRRVLVSAQMAFCLVLLVGATLFLRSLDRLSAADLGIVRDGLIALDFDVEPSGSTTARASSLAAEALRRVRALPGVEAAAMASRAPLDTSTPTVRVVAAGQDAGSALDVTFNTVTAGYLETVGTPLVTGRSFSGEEPDDVAIVNESLARRLWPAGDVVGRGLTLVTAGRTVRIIGVSRDAKYRAIGESRRPHVFLPTAPAFSHALLVRTATDPRRTLSTVQDVLDGIGPGIAGFFPRTLEDHLAVQLLPTRVAARAASWLAALALIFCGVGLYGLISWLAALRGAEIAVRLALGATGRDIARLVVRQALTTALPGLAAGMVLAAVGTATARGLLFGVGALDLLAVAGGAIVLLVLVLAASWAPARRAARTDPAAALRAQ